jgi:hypothetical protein
LYVYLSKILPIFLMPLSLVSLLVLLALVFLRRKMIRTASGLLVVSLLVLWAAARQSRHPALPSRGEVRRPVRQLQALHF